MNTTENNKIIAEFMGRVIPEDKLEFYDENPTTHYYHSNWNWLMEVVEKIESLESIGIDFYKGCIDIYNEGETFIRINRKGLTKIEAVYKACVTFIEWYNKENK